MIFSPANEERESRLPTDHPAEQISYVHTIWSNATKPPIHIMLMQIYVWSAYFPLALMVFNFGPRRGQNLAQNILMGLVDPPSPVKKNPIAYQDLPRFISIYSRAPPPPLPSSSSPGSRSAATQPSGAPPPLRWLFPPLAPQPLPRSPSPLVRFLSSARPDLDRWSIVALLPTSPLSVGRCRRSILALPQAVWFMPWRSCREGGLHRRQQRYIPVVDRVSDGTMVLAR
jgi:hypothetical protein